MNKLKLLLCYTLFNISLGVCAQTKQSKPNVIILFADDMRSTMVQGMGGDNVKTPNLDRLMNQGLAFSHAYIMGGSVGAVCMPSRAMLLTGRNLFNLTKNGKEIPRTDKTMGELFKEAGYQTYGIGKWHNGIEAYVRSFTGGDEIMFGGMPQSQWQVPLNHFKADGKYTHPSPLIDTGRTDLPEIADHVYENRHSSEIFASAAVNFIEKSKPAQPFFMYVAFTAPHDPRQSPDDYHKMYSEKDILLPDNFLPEHPFDNGHMNGRDEKLLPRPRDPQKVKKEIKDYYAIVSHLDAQIGRILDALEKTGQKENTIVIFSADNGLAVGQHGLLGKQNLYEHSVRVPMIWSGVGIPNNKKTNAYHYISDIYPTLCDMLKIEKPSTVDGTSFLPTIKNPLEKGYDKLYFSFRQFHRAVSDGKYKLIEYNVKGERHTQLFDLEKDPLEKDNLAKDNNYKTIVSKLRADLVKHRKEVNDEGAFWEGF